MCNDESARLEHSDVLVWIFGKTNVQRGYVTLLGSFSLTLFLSNLWFQIKGHYLSAFVPDCQDDGTTVLLPVLSQKQLIHKSTIYFNSDSLDPSVTIFALPVFPFDRTGYIW